MTVAEEIALQVGVCRQSVSAVLNGSRNKVRQEKREQILALAQKMNYQPNPNARSMAGRSVKTIGVIVPAYQSVISCALMNALNREILSRGFKCYIISPQSPETEQDAIREFSARKVDGIIVCFIHNLVNYEHCPIPVVVLGARREAFDLSVDFGYGMRLALDHLVRVHHHERIVFLCNCVRGNESKYAVYRDFMKDHRLPELPPLEVLEQENLAGYAEKLIRNEKVTAFAGSGDMVAGQFANLLTGMGVRIPDEAALTGYDATLLCHASPLQLSAVVHPVEDLAERSVSLLFDKIASHTLSRGEPFLIRPAFFKGQTCGCPGLPQKCRIGFLQMDILRKENPDYASFFEE